ncbi:MAG: response regulator [Pseudomonadota bacterium]
MSSVVPPPLSLAAWSAQPSASVLIVDDDPVFCASLPLILPTQWRVFSAPDIETAVHLIGTETVDLAVVDMHLLDGSGADFIRVAGALPCLLCTQDHGEPAFQAIFDDPAVSQNIVGYLTKPLRAGAIWSIRAGLQIGRERQLRDRLVGEATARLEEERRQVAGDLHDAVGAALTQLSWVLGTIERTVHTGAASPVDTPVATQIAEQCAKGRVILKQAYTDVSRAVNRLQPEEVQVVGLRGAVDYMVAQWRLTAPRVEFTFVASKEVDQIDARRAGIIYRVVQEGITNAMRHSDATAVEVQMGCREGHLSLSVQSRGRVLPSDSRFLLTSLRERTASLGGVLQFACDPAAGGSQLKITLPV